MEKAVWRAKYLEHFPRWIFFFDPDGFDQDSAATRKKLIRGIQSLGAVGAHCFHQGRSAHLLSVRGWLFDRGSHPCHHQCGSKFHRPRFPIKQGEQPKFAYNCPSFTEESREASRRVSLHLVLSLEARSHAPWHS